MLLKYLYIPTNIILFEGAGICRIQKGGISSTIFNQPFVKGRDAPLP